MGEVYRARDPRLGREVAIKVVRGEHVEGGEGRRRFEREARAAASLNHPNILTVHDVGTDSGIAYVVTELLEGENLRVVLSRRSPAPVQVLSYAVQTARGLAAAHEKGIVHRDLKPENLFLTADGRVKILDFGLARCEGAAGTPDGDEYEQRTTRSGVLLGTVAYMSPEQVKALATDARSDIFSFGVVLYELLSRQHPFRRETVAATLTAILWESPPDLTALDGAMTPVLGGIVRRCLEKDREHRFHSAHDLALALEAVVPALSGAAWVRDAEERSPYPGLSSFTEEDAAVFFGREAEVEALWRRLPDRRLAAVIGPSGVGKTSLVRAGVIASRPPGWGALLCTPGKDPHRNLGRAVAPELAGDSDALRKLLSFEDAEIAVDLVGRWRRAHAEALLVVDQFEELFTLSPKGSREAFAALLGRIARDADVHLLLSLRDDFLIRCSEHEDLAPVFESLTPLTGLGTSGLRRAVVEPAARRGYRFEDSSLVEEMIQSVEGSRGALPLLAFALAHLWETRDREGKLLTRRGYEETGGVPGALARHAEAAIGRIGPERQAIVREIFRDLVTAEGTRVAVEREELLSLFPGRTDATAVLDELIDARLLSSFEVGEKGGQTVRRRVEVVHESLLTAWPRLVRWQAQDEEGAVLRDQLKQAARLWEEKGRTADLLWTGTAYHEFELWREHYGGALTALEEDFGRSMDSRARKTRRRWRAATASAFVALAGITVAIGMSRHQAAKARDSARAESLRAEAGQLLALARTEIDRYPTAALAYARKSLEQADTPEARRLAVEVLWRGPVARILPVDRITRERGFPEKIFFGETILSPDGRWLATRSKGGHVLVFPASGGAPHFLPAPPEGSASVLAFGPEGDQLVTGGPGQLVRFLSLPDMQEERRADLGGFASWGWASQGDLVTLTRLSRDDTRPLIRAWPWAGGEPATLGRLDREGGFSLDAARRWIVYGRGRLLLRRRLDASPPPPERVIGRLKGDFADVRFLHADETLVTAEASGEMRLWSTAGGPSRPLEPPIGSGRSFLAVDREGWRLAVAGPDTQSVELLDLRDPPDAEPVGLRRPDPVYGLAAAFDPRGTWVATNNYLTVAFWPLAGPWRRTFRRPGILTMSGLSFSPDGRWLASCTGSDPSARGRLWPLRAEDGTFRVLAPPGPCSGLAFHPDGRDVLVGTPGGGAFLSPVAVGRPRRLETGWEGAVQMTGAPAIDASGRRAVASPFDMNPSIRDPTRRALRIWDLPSGRGTSVSLAHLTGDSWWGFDTLRFAPDGSVLAAGAGAGGVFRLVLPPDASGSIASESLYPAGASGFDVSADGRQMLVWASRTPGADRFEELLVLDLVRRTSRRIDTHGRRIWTGAIDASGTVIATADIDGAVRVGKASGEEPHLLLGGHTGVVWGVALSPDGRWIASVGDEAIQLWPMPDVTQPPLHALPYAELKAKLDALTNLQVIRDPASPTGWTLDIGPFPGWEDAPRW